MKRFVVGLPLLLFLTISPGLGQQEKKPLSFWTDLLPLKVGNRWIYQGVDPKEKVIVTVDRIEPVERRVSTPKGGRSEMLESFVLRITNGDKALQEQILIADDGIYRIAAAGKEIIPPLKILKLPPANGDTWTANSFSENVTMRGDFVVEAANVAVPGGGSVAGWLSKTRDFTVGDQKMEASYWFAPGVGIVKQHVRVGKFVEMKIALDEFKPAAGANPGLGLPTLPKAPPPLDLK